MNLKDMSYEEFLRQYTTQLPNEVLSYMQRHPQWKNEGFFIKSTHPKGLTITCLIEHS